ncbi:MAG: sigma-70 family RNA polymerase sigma factor [Verrucomicrobiota bacterium]
MLTSSPKAFPVTRWSLILQANSGNQRAQARAMEELCSIYWAPLYAFARSRGHSVEDSEDFTQTFVARLVHRDALKSVEPRDAKLRSFLLTLFQRFLIDEWRGNQAQKRGGDTLVISLDAELAESKMEIDSDLSPEKLFERNWARTLLAQVLKQLEKSYRDRGKEDLFVVLRPFIDGGDDASYEKAAQTLGGKIETIRVYVHRLRKDFQELIRSELAETLTEGEDLEEELRYLLAAFSSS